MELNSTEVMDSGDSVDIFAAEAASKRTEWPEWTSTERAAFVGEFADDKRAIDIVTLDLQGVTLVADYFVICSGTSDVHVRSIAEGIEEAMKKKKGVRPFAVQGRQEANWIILDYGDVVVHVFSEVERAHYDLEEFWKHARVVERVLAGRPGAEGVGGGV